MSMFTASEPNLTLDLMNTIALFGLAIVLTLTYAVRSAIKGRAHYDRVDRQGGSILLSKSIMEMGYWVLQPVARLLVFFRVTPNMISWGSLAIGILAGACLAFGHFGFGAVFGTISALFDSLDGLVARMTQKASDAGEVLDAAIDRYVEFAYLGGLVIYYREMPSLVILTLLALLGSLMVSYSTAKAEALHVVPPRGSMRRTERALYLILGALLCPISIPWLEMGNFTPVHIGYPMVVALGLVAVLANFSAVERLLAVARAVRAREAAELQALSGTLAVQASASHDGHDESDDSAPVVSPATAEAHSHATRWKS